MHPECRHLVVDGHSVIFSLPRLCALHASRPRAARAALVKALQQFQDFSGTRVSVAFDGRGGEGEFCPPGAVEIRYAEAGQTADAIIERAVAAHPRPAEIVVVTRDDPERAMVESLGARALSPLGLLDWIRAACPPGTAESLGA